MALKRSLKVLQIDAFDAGEAIVVTVWMRGKKKGTRDGVLRKRLRELGLWRWQGRKVIKNRVQRGSRGGPERSSVGPGEWVWFSAKARSRSGCAGA